ncbi:MULTISPECIES: glycosyltransferase [Arthrobacter]|uniref:glycosyltransferase n=1 Tax=Arthrobacter TaxID=1663 RepID=UPI0033954D1F
MNHSSSIPDADIIIAVHQLNRPIKRAVLSALAAGKPGQVRVIVVGHGLEVEDLRQLLVGCPAELVEVVKYVDGIRSPAGPFNAGLKLAHAEFVGVMGSDDMLESEAVSAWVDQARTSSADAVLAPLKFQSGRSVRTPRIRGLRRFVLDPVRDRVAYRTAPLGLLRRTTLHQQALAFTEGLTTGEDVSFSLRLWFGGNRISMGRPGRHYIIGEDAQERVTQRMLPLHQEFEAFFGVLKESWFAAFPLASRRSIAIKMARIHVIPAMSTRGTAWDWAGPDGVAVQEILVALENAAPRFSTALCRADHSLLAAVPKMSGDTTGFILELENFARARHLDRLLTKKFRDNFRVESNVRYFLDLKVERVLQHWRPSLAAQ